MPHLKNETIANGFFQKLTDGETDSLLSFVTDDTEIHVCVGNQLHSDSFTGTFMGKSGAANFFNICRQYLDFDYIRPVSFHHESRKMIIRGVLKCQVLATGRIWESGWMQIWTLENDHLQKIRMFADLNDAAMAATAAEQERNIFLRH